MSPRPMLETTPVTDTFVSIPLTTLTHLLTEDAFDHRTPGPEAVAGWIGLMDCIGAEAMSEVVGAIENGMYQASLVTTLNALIAAANQAEQPEG